MDTELYEPTIQDQMQYWASVVKPATSPKPLESASNSKEVVTDLSSQNLQLQLI
jgi:hypothetical protein